MGVIYAFVITIETKNTPPLPQSLKKKETRKLETLMSTSSDTFLCITKINASQFQILSTFLLEMNLRCTESKI